MAGYLVYGSKSLEDCAKDMVHLCEWPGYWNIPERLRYTVAGLMRRTQSDSEMYDKWEIETAFLVSRLVKNRAEAKKQLKQVHANSWTERDLGLIEERSPDAWQEDWRVSFDFLTGPMLTANNRFPVLEHKKGLMLLRLWHRSFGALNKATDYSCGTGRDDKSFETLFKRTAEVSINRFENIANLWVSSVPETDMLHNRQVEAVEAAVSTDDHAFKLPGNALHILPERYGLAITKSAKVAICLPENSMEVKADSHDYQRSYVDLLTNVIGKDIEPLTKNWSNQAVEADLRLLVFVPRRQIPLTYYLSKEPEMEFKKYLLDTIRKRCPRMHSRWHIKFVFYNNMEDCEFPAKTACYTLINDRLLVQSRHKDGLMCGKVFAYDKLQSRATSKLFKLCWARASGPSGSKD
jgi:hypothetical protein